MLSSFWSNTIWYILLLITSIIAMIAALLKSKKRKFTIAFSQLSISTTSALTIVFDLSYGWYFVFAFTYYLIEELFIRLGIYQHLWYKSIHTLAGFVPFFGLFECGITNLSALQDAFIIYLKDGWAILITLYDLLGTYFWIIVLNRFLSQKPAVYCKKKM